MPYTQDRRSIAVETPLDKDVLLLEGFRGQESVSRLFQYELDLLSESPAVPFETLVGRPATISVKLADGKTDRYFHGVISRFTQLSTEGSLTRYRAELVPWLWLLTRSSDCRIFQGQSIPVIVTELFERFGFKDYRTFLRTDYPKQEFCVQYRETHFNFVSRLLEHAGIYYYFVHEKARHVLVLADGSSKPPSCPGQAKVPYQRTQGAPTLEHDVVTDWSVEQDVRSAKYALGDFNFLTPANPLTASVGSLHKSPALPKAEMYDYPGEFAKREQGNAIAKIRMEEEEAQRVVIRGTGTCRTFLAGHRFELTGHHRTSANAAYVLTTVSHAAHEPGYTTGSDDVQRATYANSFVCQPAATVLRPQRLTPRPLVSGPQTAIVVGKQGEEFLADEHGRIRVQFHWDRIGERNENSSCWIRVAQPWAGQGWGAMFIPRVGQEVIVEFLEGDPDAPIVTGTVYNGGQRPPYELPKHQTRTTIKSNSSKGGGGANELRFEDKKGDEQIFVHAQKDLDVVIEQTRRESVGKDRHLIVTGDRLDDIGGALHVKVGGDRVSEIGGSLSEKAQEIYLKAGSNIIIEGTEITLKAGGAFIKIDQSGVTVQGTMVKINSGGSAGSGSAKSVKSAAKPKL